MDGKVEYDRKPGTMSNKSHLSKWIHGNTKLNLKRICFLESMTFGNRYVISVSRIERGRLKRTQVQACVLFFTLD